MDPLLLKTVHLAGVFALFMSMGSILTSDSEECRKKSMMMHGISLLLIAGVGFAMLKKPPMDQHWWQVKLGMWLFLGVAPVLAKRDVLPKRVLLLLCLAAGILAAWMGLAKPF